MSEFSSVIKATLTSARADLGGGGGRGSGIFLKIQTYQIRIVKLPKIGLRPIWQTKLLFESPIPGEYFLDLRMQKVTKLQSESLI